MTQKADSLMTTIFCKCLMKADWLMMSMFFKQLKADRLIQSYFSKHAE